MARLILHAGTHKTGTTTIQGVLAANRAALAERGVYYPAEPAFFGTPDDAQSANAHFATALAIARYGDEDRRNLERFLGHLREVGGAYETIVLSAEPLYRLMVADADVSSDEQEREARREFVERMARLFAEHALQPEILLYFRRPDRFAESLYAEMVAKAGAKGTFETFLGIRPFRFDYRFQIDLFGRHFRTRPYAFEEKAREGLVESFFCDNGLGPAPAGESLRRSIPNCAVLWLRRAKRDAKLARREQRVRWLFALQPASADLFQADRPSTFWPSAARRDAFLRPRLAQTPEFAFPEPEPPPPLCVWSDDMHRAAEAAFAAWRRANRTWIAGREAAKLQPFAL
jgi:hypothetical protein